MNVELCKKCNHWSEEFGMDNENHIAILKIGCEIDRPNCNETRMKTIPLDSVDNSHCLKKFRNNEYAVIRNHIKKEYEKILYPRTTEHCDRSQRLKNSLEIAKDVFKDEYANLEKKAIVLKVSEKCPYYTEHTIEDWNK